MTAVLDIHRIDTGRGEWTIAAKHTRAGGDVDVVLARREKTGAPHKGKSRTQLFAFRGREGEWAQLVGCWVGLSTALRESSRCTRTQVMTVQYVVPLLDVAAGMPDFPRLDEVTDKALDEAPNTQMDNETAQESL